MCGNDHSRCLEKILNIFARFILLLHHLCLLNLKGVVIGVCQVHRTPHHLKCLALAGHEIWVYDLYLRTDFNWLPFNNYLEVPFTWSPSPHPPPHIQQNRHAMQNYVQGTFFFPYNLVTFPPIGSGVRGACSRS